MRIMYTYKLGSDHKYCSYKLGSYYENCNYILSYDHEDCSCNLHVSSGHGNCTCNLGSGHKDCSVVITEIGICKLAQGGHSPILMMGGDPNNFFESQILPKR